MVASGITGRTRPTKVKKRENLQKRKRDDVDVEKLEQAVQELVRSRRATDLSIRS
jgi:ATP-dependent RNA helicase DDX10/DBP4